MSQVVELFRLMRLPILQILKCHYFFSYYAWSHNGILLHAFTHHASARLEALCSLFIRPSVRLSLPPLPNVTFVNTVFWQRMNWFWYKLPRVVCEAMWGHYSSRIRDYLDYQTLSLTTAILTGHSRLNWRLSILTVINNPIIMQFDVLWREARNRSPLCMQFVMISQETCGKFYFYSLGAFELHWEITWILIT